MLVGACAALMLMTAGSVAPSAVGASTGQNYIIVYKSENVPANAAKKIEQAGGTLVYSYDQIGVVIARSSNPSFRTSLPKADIVGRQRSGDGGLRDSAGGHAGATQSRANFRTCPRPTATRSRGSSGT